MPDTVAVYRILPNSIAPSTLVTTKAFTTTRHRRVYMTAISNFDLFKGDTEVLTTAYPASKGWKYRIVKGNSSNPMFVVNVRALILLSAHTFAGVTGKGPHCGGPGNKQKIRHLISRLGGGRSAALYD